MKQKGLFYMILLLSFSSCFYSEVEEKWNNGVTKKEKHYYKHSSDFRMITYYRDGNRESMTYQTPAGLTKRYLEWYDNNKKFNRKKLNRYYGMDTASMYDSAYKGCTKVAFELGVQKTWDSNGVIISKYKRNKKFAREKDYNFKGKLVRDTIYYR